MADIRTCLGQDVPARQIGYELAGMQRILGAVAVLALLWSCHPSAVSTLHRPHRISGEVHSASHATARDSLIIVTDLATSKEISATRVNPDGTFEVKTSASQVALTATSPTGWAYLPKVDVNDRKHDIQLSGECMPLRGRVHAGRPMPESMELVRLERSDNVGDVFAASLDHELQFTACLPQAQYQIYLPRQFAHRLIVADVPAQVEISVDTVTQQSAETPPSKPVELGFLSRDGFVRQLPDAVDVLGLGEANHGTGEFIRERAEVMIALARERGFATILLEAAFAGVLPANAYIHGAAIDSDVALSQIGFQVLRTEEMREALQALRTYNQKTTTARQISIFGIDMQRSAGAVDDLLTADVGLTPEEASLLARLRVKDGADWKKFGPSERIVTTRSLERIASMRGPGGVAADVNRHALCARSLRLLLDLVDARAVFDGSRKRDHAMAQLAQAVLEIEPKGRATLWAHLDHVSREYVVGIPSLGSYLSSALGEHYRAYGLLAYEGAASARDFQRLQAPPVVFPLSPAPAYSVEGVLTRSGGGSLPEISYWTFGAPATRSAPWLTGLRLLRAFGYAYPGDARSFQLHNLAAIDGVVLFKTVTPTRLLTLPPPTPPPPAPPTPP